jgi:hypothetical protein
MENSMEIIRKAKEGKLPNSFEKYHILLTAKKQIQMNST